MHRTRIKICGLTREQDVACAVAAGADALGFVFYANSPRYVTAERARALISAVPAFVTKVGLFVNAPLDEVVRTVQTAGIDLIQFHGDESPEFCEAVSKAAGRPFVRAFSVGPQTTGQALLNSVSSYPAASAWMFDTASAGYGGSGKTFEWSVLDQVVSNASARPLVLSGGLSAQNVAEAIRQVRPFAVDVSSGVESAKGIKDAQKIAEFVAAVRAADAN
ncbi:MAG: phosphoribosylanthranilate isomerase [Burkholderiaceae bacterium]